MGLVTSIDVSGRVAAEHRAPRPTSSVAAPAESHAAACATCVSAYVGLTKPRIIELLLVTTVPAMFLAARRRARRCCWCSPPWSAAAWPRPAPTSSTASSTATSTSGCGAPAAARCPGTPSAPRAATVFGAVLGVAATLWLGFFVNWLSAGLALAANAFYIFVYTLLAQAAHRRRTSSGAASPAASRR